MVMIIRTS